MDRTSHELRAVIATNVIRRAANGEQILSYFNHRTGCERVAHFDGQALARGLIDHGQQLHLPAVLSTVRDKVI